MTRIFHVRLQVLAPAHLLRVAWLGLGRSARATYGGLCKKGRGRGVEKKIRPSGEKCSEHFFLSPPPPSTDVRMPENKPPTAPKAWPMAAPTECPTPVDDGPAVIGGWL